MENGNWSINVNFNPDNTPVEARQGQAGMGFYKVRCSDTTYYPLTDDGKKPFIRLALSITESAHDTAEVGNTVSDRVNVPSDAQTPDARAWTERFLKTTLIGLGHDKAEVSGAAGGITLNSEAFKGSEGYMHYEPYNPNDKGSNSNITWVTSEQYARALKGEFKVPLKNAGSSSIDTPVISATAGFTSTSNNGGGMALGGAPTTGSTGVGSLESLLAIS
tara:strand:+ start:100 stop:756 length:657 start_codon:yes stop_codon:yes gene_type:complete